jgi:putative transposase
MPRGLRQQAADEIFHVTARGVRRTDLFRDDRDRSHFIELLRRVVQRRRWQCHAYCLMPNHYHLTLHTPEADLSVGMHWLNSCYAQRFNEKHGYEGHVFDRRFNSRLIESDAHLLEVMRYVVLNPVRAGLCSHPGEWPWSSYGAAVGKVPRPPFLVVDSWLKMFGSDLRRAASAFDEFVAEGTKPF